MDPDCDPARLLWIGQCLKISSQNIPHASEELKENSKEWVQLQQAFAPVFEWITELVWFN